MTPEIETIKDHLKKAAEEISSLIQDDMLEVEQRKDVQALIKISHNVSTALLNIKVYEKLQ